LYQWVKATNVRDSILDFITRQEPDIICLQEFHTSYSQTGQNSEAHVINNLSRTPHHHIHYRKHLTKHSNKGLATFSSYPIVNRGSVSISESINACIYSDIAVEQDTIRVFNVHLQSYHFSKNNYNILDSMILMDRKKQLSEARYFYSKLKFGFKIRALQADLIKKEIDASPYPVLLCGDFNDTPVSYTYQRILGDLSDSFVTAGHGTGITYNGPLPSYRIDYILHDKQFSPVQFHIFRTNFSDHYPVFAKLGLP
jgi:endonuclease/exonuclease/phosphatase family metal-dependent hydrolase